jgi:predicted GNAT family N-acyltransferase
MASSIQALEHQPHDVKSFDCGVEVLNNWLGKMAKQHAEKNISRTYVLVDDNNPRTIFGYYAITPCQVVASAELPPDKAKKLPRNVPGFRLGRLARSVLHDGKRIGETLLLDAMNRAKQLSMQAGGNALFVDAMDDGAAAFYHHYGFVQSPDDPHKLFMPMTLIPG